MSAFLSQREIGDLRKQVEEDLSGVFTITNDPFNSGQQAIVLINRLPESEWQFVSLLPATALQNPSERSIVQMIAVTIVGMAALGWITYNFISRAVSAPLKTLGTAAQFGFVEILGAAQAGVLDIVLDVEEELVPDTVV